MTERDDNVLRCDGLSVRYATRAGEVAALADVSLDVRAGEMFGVIGMSGSGKSTLALAVMDYLGRGGRVASGRIHRHGKAAMVYQDPATALNPSMRIGAQIAEAGVYGAGLSWADAERRAHDLLADMRIDDPARIMDAYPHRLSGGQQQRCVIAMALIADPALLVLDEPTASLDATVGADILKALQVYAEKRRIACLFISHDLSAVRRLCARVVVMGQGRVVEAGTPAEVFGAPASPQARALVAAWQGDPPAPRTLDEAAPAVLRIEGLSKVYGGTLRVLKDIGLTVRAGETLALIGESGAGKSTLAWIVAGLQSASGGVVEVLGGDVAHMPAHRRTREMRSRVQIVFQNPAETLNPAHTVGMQLRRAVTVLMPNLERDADISARVRDLLRMVALDESVLDRRPSQLSGGQVQRVAIARALAGGPDLLIMDEPLSALDATVRNEIVKTLRALRAETNMAILFVTHDLIAARDLADRVVVLRNGAVVESGRVETTFAHPRESYTASLVQAVSVEPVL